MLLTRWHCGLASVGWLLRRFQCGFECVSRAKFENCQLGSFRRANGLLRAASEQMARYDGSTKTAHAVTVAAFFWYRQVLE